MMTLHGIAFGLCAFNVLMFVAIGNPAGAAIFFGLAVASVYSSRYGHPPVRVGARCRT